MRLTMAIVFAIMIVALIICAIMASRSKKAIGLVVAFAVTCIIFPIVGNLIITVSTSEKLSTIGYYIYFIGMDILNLPMQKSKKCSRISRPSMIGRRSIRRAKERISAITSSKSRRCAMHAAV